MSENQYLSTPDVIRHLLAAHSILAADDNYILFADGRSYLVSLETMRAIRHLLERVSAPYPTVFWLSETGLKTLREQEFWETHARVNSVSHCQEASLTETYKHIKTLRPGLLLSWKTSEGKWLFSVQLRKLADRGIIHYAPPPFPDMFLSGRYTIPG